MATFHFSLFTFHLKRCLATWFGLGLIPFAPGTMGALGGLVLWGVGAWLLPPLTLTLLTAAAIIVFTPIGAWVSGEMERYWGEDPRAAVIDEVVGVWIPLLAAAGSGATWWLAIAAFLLFRLFDIWKPLGCRWIDTHIHGGWGIMLDDLLAGFYALLVVLLLRCLFT